MVDHPVPGAFWKSTAVDDEVDAATVTVDVAVEPPPSLHLTVAENCGVARAARLTAAGASTSAVRVLLTGEVTVNVTTEVSATSPLLATARKVPTAFPAA